MTNRCILDLKSSSIDELNNIMIRRFLGKLHTYISLDKTIDPRHQGDYEDFFNFQNPKGLPSHRLMLKENCPIILVRNLNPLEGLCNGTRFICRELGQHTISAEIVFICREFLFQKYPYKLLTIKRNPLHSKGLGFLFDLILH